MGPPNSAAARSPLAPAALLALASGASAVLAFDALGLFNAPGCGRDGACASAARSAFGHLPGLDWPTSFAGLAWFSALLAAWIAARGSWTRAFRAFALGGVALSIVLVGALLALGHLCPWCLAAHAANCAFAWLVSRSQRANTAPRAPWIVFALVFAFVSGGLAFARSAARDSARTRAESELARSTDEIRAATESAPRFTGRWRLGPEHARARVVVFTDYQCPDCQRVEAELEAYAAAHADVSLSVKHFPMCPECNRHAPNMHPNACWAARAAEVAGALGGNDGFWRMHRWLFARAGSFTKAELEAALPGLGFDAPSFQRALNAPESLTGITADVEEAMALGLARTPLVYVNGVELRGWDAPGAVARVLDSVTNAPAAASDRPANAREKILGDWRAEPVRAIAPAQSARTLGRADAPVVITLFGDYQDEFTVAADRELRALVLARDDVRYVYRYFPANTACNPGLPRTLHPLACLAALGAELAAALQGESGFWVMHDWLMEHREGFDDAKLLAQAKVMGIDETAFWEVLKSAELGSAIADDVAAAKELGVESIPAIWIDGRRLMRWQSGSESLFPVVIDEARRR